MAFFQSNWKDILTIVGLGSLIGTVLTYWLTGHLEHKKWVSDNKKQEYRELLSTVLRWYLGELSIKAAGFVALRSEDQRKLSNAAAEAAQVFQDRLFIFSSLRKANVIQDWNDLVRDAPNMSVADFVQSFDRLRLKVIAIAHSDLKIRE